MARLSIVLAGVLIVGLVALGTVQTVLELPESSLAGAVALEQNDQRDINLCMNDCMRGCVVQIEDDGPCRDSCEVECGVR